METEVTDNFNFDTRTRRVTFVAQDDIWALRFGTAATYQKFVTGYNDKLFVNTYGVDNDEANRSKVDTFCDLGVHGTGDQGNHGWSRKSAQFAPCTAA